ncbi:DUF4115 domain-containing protein [candidate division KSB1 bacterium]|nr:DUF4115 domain-containing protein [candidate division KSB1 bacterium]
MSTKRHHFNEKIAAIGAELQQRRQAKGMTLEELSEKTKISLRFLESMERGDFEFLPPTYTHAFLKTVSVILGLDPNVMIERLSFSRPSLPAPGEKKPLSGDSPAGRRKAKRIWPILGKPAFWGVLGAVVLFFLVLLLNTSEPPREQSVSLSTPPPQAPESVVAEKPERIETTRFLSEPQATSGSATMRLEATAVETTWVRIVYADTLVDEAIFYPGDFRVWSSATPFYLKIGNGSGLQLKINSQELGTPGITGRVSNIRVDESGAAMIPANEFPER